MERIGPYEIVSELARDAGGRTFLVSDPAGGEPLELRTLELPAALSPGERAVVLERFLVDGQILCELRYPGIETVRDAGQADGVPYLVRERFEAVAFEAHTRADTLLPIETVAALVADAAEALACAHRVGLVHRDLRPSRLFRIGTHGARVSGFGEAPSEGGRDAERVDPSYTSPEQIRGSSPDAWSDLFSLCVVLYVMLTGRRPFEGRDPSSILYRIVHEEPPGPTRDGTPLGGRIAAILRRGLAKDPQARFADGEALAAELRVVAESPRTPAPDQTVEHPASAIVGGPVSPPGAAPGAEPPRRSTPRRGSSFGFVLGIVFLIAIVGGAAWTFRDRFLSDPPPPPVAWLEATVRTVPPGLEVQLDGRPLEQAGRVRFPSGGPFGTLRATLGCREMSHPLSAADAGTEVTLVGDPIELELPVDPALPGAGVRLNGKPMGETPVKLALDLCEENRVEIVADGYRTSVLTFAAGATPLDVRKQLYAIELEPIPMGRLLFPQTSMQLVYYLDGRRLGISPRELELEAGEYALRFKNEYHFIEGSAKVRIEAGKASTPRLNDLELTTLTVQAFPPNCKAWARRPGGQWRLLDETPATRRVSPGRYEVKVMLNPTGETRVEDVELAAGKNPPVRVSFGRRG